MAEARLNITQTTGGSSWYQITGLLKNSFEQFVSDNEAELINTCFYAAFVEYGTGIVGQQSGHPDVRTGWKYRTTPWAFYADNGTSSPAPEKWGEGASFYDLNMHITAGQPAHMYMYNAIMTYLNGGMVRCFREAFEEGVADIK